jgi:hypothetical protein
MTPDTAASVADLVAWPIVRGHLQRSLQELKQRVEARPTVRSAPAVGKRRHHTGRATKARQQ